MRSEPENRTLQLVKSRSDYDHRSDVFRSQQGALSITIYPNLVPEFAEEVLERLYKNIYCTRKRLELYHSLDNVSTYVASDNSDIQTLLLFRVSKDTVYVLNQQIALPENQITIFAKVIFENYRKARRIEFYALDVPSTIFNLGYPYQAIKQLEENIISLPGSDADFLKLMSPQVRKKLLSIIRKTKKEHPSYCFSILTGPDINEKIIAEIVNLANKRMYSKKRPSYIAEQEIPILTQLASRYGFTGLITIDGTLKAANLTFRVGERSFSRLIAHDPSYDAYSLGNQAQFFSIIYFISLGGREYWMSGGGSYHKAQFSASRRDLQNITLYRSRKTIFFCCAGYFQIKLRKKLISIRENLKNKSREPTQIGNMTAQVLNFIRATKTMLSTGTRSIRRTD